MKLHPFDEVIAAAHLLIQKGHTVLQQFNCAQCGRKQTMETPNVFYHTGQCEECKHITNIAANGCNYMVVLSPGRLT
jgi:hypothetical protein